MLSKVGKKSSLCLIDIKEAVRAAAPSAPDAKMPKNHAERVIEGAQSLSPYLGKRMLAAELLGKPVVLRELLPQDLKLEMERLTRKEIVTSDEIRRPCSGLEKSSLMTRDACVERSNSNSFPVPDISYEQAMPTQISYQH